MSVFYKKKKNVSVLEQKLTEVKKRKEKRRREKPRPVVLKTETRP